MYMYVCEDLSHMHSIVILYVFNSIHRPMGYIAHIMLLP